MTKEDLLELKRKLSELTESEKEERDLYLRQLALGEIQGPLTGYPTIDKPWLKYFDEDILKKEMPIANSYDFIYDINKDNLDKNAINYYNNIITFKNFFENIECVEKAFRDYGIKRGDIVTISLPNMPEAVYIYYALSKIGAISNMIDPRTSKEGIENYINEVSSKLFISIDVIEDKLVDVYNNTKVENIILVSPSESLPPLLKKGFKLKELLSGKKHRINYVSWHSFFNSGKESKTKLVKEPYVPNTPVLIVHTGGTTGMPKGVVLSNENINSIAFYGALFPTNLKEEHKWLDIMPPFIAYGIGSGLHFPLSLKMETILIPQFKPEEFDKLILKYKPNHIAGVPVHWNYIINSQRLKNKDLSYLVTCAVGGDSMDIKLEEKATEFLKSHGCEYGIAKGYGMTEVDGSIGRTTNTDNELGTVGIPFCKSSVGIFNPGTEEELGYNQVGEIYMTGPNMMLGYYNNDAETKNIMKKHSDDTTWIHSGDIGYIKENGNIFVVDRIKRIIIRHDGFKIFPHYIENIIIKHNGVKQCKVVGKDDYNHVQGKLPVAFIVRQDGYSDTDENLKKELIQMCENELPEYSQPVDFFFKEKLPLTPVGKVDVIKLEEELNDSNQKILRK